MANLRQCLKIANPLKNQIKCLRLFSSKSDTKLVDVSVNESTGVATVSMQRLPVNGLNLELIQALGNTLGELEKQKARGAILTSASPTVFSAGLDILEMYQPDPNRMKQFWTSLQDLWIKLYGTSYPTVAAINGHAPAGGCLLSLSCEYRVMVSGFTIGLNETQLGIAAPTWFQASMRNAIGQRNTELALTQGRMFTTDEAAKIGLIDETATDKADAISKAEKFIASFSKVSPWARGQTKMALRAKDIQDLVQNKDADYQQFASVVSNPKVQQGLGLYLQSLKKQK